MPMLANVFSGSAGVAVFVTLSSEVGRAMVLFYPALKKQIFEEGHQEGHQEGRLEGREEGRMMERDAWEAWNQRREKALADGQPFDEPPPSRSKNTS
jgi:hypothetical protein